MDGNGRWAERRHLPRLFGHRAGAEALDRMMHYCIDAGVEYLTVYAFSTENWKRSAEEVGGLMKLLSNFIHSKEKALIENSIRFRVIGRRGDLSEKLQDEIAALEEKTKAGKFTLLVALSYGGRDEIVRAAGKLVDSSIRRFADSGLSVDEYLKTLERETKPAEENFASFMDAPDVPDPDLIIRTSGEVRVSNFLLWQSAYSEYYFTDVLWPDFDRAEFDRALESFSKRERRMGGRLR